MNNPLKIALVHMHSNGDCLYATAIARQIKQDFPGCHLTWVIASMCKTIIDNNPFVDAVIEIPDVNRFNNTGIYKKLKKEMLLKKQNGTYDEVFFTQLIDDNLANYDGSVRSGILRNYGKPITVSLTPVLRLRQEEIENVRFFAEKYHLNTFKNIILFEFAPQSGQLAITTEIALDIANQLIQNENTAIILSSNIKIGDANQKIIDGSTLTLRETATLTHYCTLLLGCSSGISWISTSDASKQLPMVQLLDPNAYWVNPISRDFERFGFPTDNLIEIYDNIPVKVTQCIKEIFNNGFAEARKKFYTPLPIQFKTTSRTIYNMLCFLQFKAIATHIKVNISVYGFHPLLVKEIVAGFITAPFKLIGNILKKHILKKK